MGEKTKSVAVKSGAGKLIALEQQFEVSRELVQEYLASIGSPLSDFQRESFIKMAIALHLNPLLREIYAVTYKDRKTGKINMNTIVGYEVNLKRAERTGLLNGWDKDIGFEDDENGKKQMFAWIEIYRKDWERPFKHKVYYSEYVQKYWDNDKKENVITEMWRKKPRTMLIKVVIAQGFRLAFPEHLGGLPYTQEEWAPPQEIGFQIVEESEGNLLDDKKVDSEKEPEDSLPTEEEIEDRKNELKTQWFKEGEKGSFHYKDIVITQHQIYDWPNKEYVPLFTEAVKKVMQYQKAEKEDSNKAIEKIQAADEKEPESEEEAEDKPLTLKQQRELLKEWANQDSKVNEFFVSRNMISEGATVEALLDGQVKRYYANEKIFVEKFKEWKSGKEGA